jgi:predicted porin
MNVYRVAVATALAVGLSSAALVARAQTDPDSLKRQIDTLQRQVDTLKNNLDQVKAQQPSAPATTASTGGHEFLERKAGDGITFFTRGGEVSLYGTLDVSLDYATKGIKGMVGPNGDSPAGNGGWMPDISTNISYFGVRGFQSVGTMSTNFVYQLEAQVDLSVTPGTPQTNSNQGERVASALVSRNSFIGFADPGWGAVKIGKTDAPYKTSTARMNAFVGMVGDYSAIMGNTGGDNRVEFGTRFSHAAWYESPKWGGVSFAALFSPGQNRADDSSNIPAGEPECAGGNSPGSGGLPVACNDGSFSNAWSAALSYDAGPLYATAAYEMHKKVNRTSDLPAFDPNDVADEDAWKIGAQYKLPTKTTLSAVWESMKRHVPGSLEPQNERTRTGFWLALSQDITQADSLHLGWAHANRANGDPGQHNPPADAMPDPVTGNGFANADNRANMYTTAWKHLLDKNTMVYANYATTVNSRFAHYDLGAGGRSVTTDCHDAANPDTSGFDPNGGAPHCWTGGRLQAFSIGLNYKF